MKDQLLKYGIDDELATKIADDFKNYVPYSRFKEVLDERNKLKGNNINVDDLLKQINELKEENAVNKANYDKSLYDLNLTNKIDNAIKSKNGKNLKAIKSLLDLDQIKLNDDGSVVNLDEQLQNLLQTEPYLFDSKSDKTFKGITLVNKNTDTITKADFDKMGYKDKMELYNTDKALYDTLKGD